MAKAKMNFPPFPPLKWDGYLWVGEISLRSWAGFQADWSSVPGALMSREPIDPVARLWVVPPEGGARSKPLPAQVAAYEYLLQNEAKVADAVVRALVKYCPGPSYDGDDRRLHKVKEPSQLESLVGLSSVHVLNVVERGTACVGFQFDCVWDEEHGAGVMTHNGKVIAVGDADCAFDERTARDGLGRMKGKK